MELSVIVVSFNTRDVTLACLRALFERTKTPAFEVILVDNASSDGTAEAVRDAFSEVRLIANADNRGFAAANNQGLAVAKGRYVLLLNPDTEVDEGCVDRTLAFAMEHPEAGVVGVRAMGSDGRQQSTLMRFPRLRYVLLGVLVPNRLMRRSAILGHERYLSMDLDVVQEVDVVCGCFMLVPREVVERVGVLDEDFFMYGEEVEWCHRIKRAGWRVLYFPDASIVHYGGASTEKLMDQMSLSLARSQLAVFQKTRGPFVALIANSIMFLRDLPRTVLWKLIMLTRLPLRSDLQDAFRHSAQRCSLHARGLLTLDWGAQARANGAGAQGGKR